MLPCSPIPFPSDPAALLQGGPATNALGLIKAHSRLRLLLLLSPLPPPYLVFVQIELLYFRGACYHALGMIKEAVRDYDIAMAWNKVWGYV